MDKKADFVQSTWLNGRGAVCVLMIIIIGHNYPALEIHNSLTEPNWRGWLNETLFSGAFPELWRWQVECNYDSIQCQLYGTLKLLLKYVELPENYSVQTFCHTYLIIPLHTDLSSAIFGVETGLCWNISKHVCLQDSRNSTGKFSYNNNFHLLAPGC